MQQLANNGVIYKIKDYAVLQKSNRLPPRTLILDFTMTHVRFGRSHLHPIGQLSHTRSSDGTPDPDGALLEAARIKIRHYRQPYLTRPDPIAFLTLVVDTSGRIYDDFIRILFLRFDFESVMKIFIPLDLSSQSFIPLPRFISFSLSYIVSNRFPSPFSSAVCLSGMMQINTDNSTSFMIVYSSVTFFSLNLVRKFFYSDEINSSIVCV